MTVVGPWMLCVFLSRPQMSLIRLPCQKDSHGYDCLFARNNQRYRTILRLTELSGRRWPMARYGSGIAVILASTALSPSIMSARGRGRVVAFFEVFLMVFIFMYLLCRLVMMIYKSTENSGSWFGIIT